MKIKRLLLLMTASSLLWGAPLTARGRAEMRESAPRGLPVFLIFAAGAEPDPAFTERYDLPLAAAAYGWAEFSVRGGEVTLREKGGLRILSRRQVSRRTAGGLVVVGYELKASGYQTDAPPPREVLTVRFSYSRTEGDLAVQPARRALLEGIRTAGTDSGFVRLKELDHLGGGRFRARVALR